MNIVNCKEITDEIYNKVYEFHNFGFYHTKQWHMVLQQSFGWQIGAYLLKEKGDLVGVLPYCTKFRIGCGFIKVSLPFSHSLVPATVSEAHIKTFFKVLHTQGVDIEVHSACSEGIAYNYVSVLNLKNYSSSQCYFESLPGKSCKYMIGRARKEGIQVVSGYEKGLFSEFYQMELETRKRLGAPMYPQRFFLNMQVQAQESGYVRVYIARHEGEPVAGVVLFLTGSTAVYAYGATSSDRSKTRLGGNDLALYSAIVDCIDAGYSVFDFGTTPMHLQGLLKFKEKWNANTTLLPYTYVNGDNGVKRDGVAVNLASSILKVVPTWCFKLLSVPLLKIAI